MALLRREWGHGECLRYRRSINGAGRCAPAWIAPLNKMNIIVSPLLGLAGLTEETRSTCTIHGGQTSAGSAFHYVARQLLPSTPRQPFLGDTVAQRPRAYLFALLFCSVCDG